MGVCKEYCLSGMALYSDVKESIINRRQQPVRELYRLRY